MKLAMLFLFVTLLVTLQSSYAQYFNNGQDRSAIRWNRISTLNFEVVFPEGFEGTAIEVANMMEKARQHVTQSLNHQAKKVSVILHNETVKSNAFLGWAPSRIEMYTTPHQKIYAQDWLEQLAIHEYRHMVQLSKLETEMPKLFRILFGEHAAAALVAAYLPFWFIEGDAVATETALSNSGRGRLPDFQKELRAQFVENGRFTYDKAYMGSYKNHIPNFYRTGYFLVSGARYFSGKPVWDEVLSQVAKKPLSLNAFDKGLKNSIGMNKIQLYDSVFSFLEKKWIANDSLIIPTESQTIVNQPKYYTNYQYGSLLNDSLYFAFRTGINDVQRLITIDKYGNEKIAFSPGSIFQESLSSTDELVIWSERLNHRRWQHADRSLIRIMNLETGKLTEYKHNEKYFAPALSPDKSQFLVVEADENYRFYIAIIDAKTGEIIKRFDNKQNDYYITPSWSSKGQHIYTIALRNNQKAVLKINVESGESEEIIPFANRELISPVEYNGILYLVAAYNGIDQLLAFDLQDNDLFLAVTSRFGLANPKVTNNQLIYSSYSANGYQLSKVNIDSLRLQQIDFSSLRISDAFADELAQQEGGIVDFESSENIDYQYQRYSKAANFFNIHSWAPFSLNPYSYQLYPGISFFGQNLLSTAEFMGGYRYRWENKQGEFYAKLKYMAWWPIFDIDVSHGKRDSYYFSIQNYNDKNNQLVRSDTLKNEFIWYETNFALNVSLPFDLSKGRYYSKLQPRAKYNYLFVKGNKKAPSFFPDGNYQSVEAGINYYYLLNASQRDVLPNFGFFIDLLYQKLLTGANSFGSLMAISNWWYLPGISKNHGISFYQGAQLKQRDEYAFSDKIKYPRGYQPFLNDRLYTFALDYRLPLWYPEVNLGKWVYFKRFKLAVFYDWAIYDGSTTFANIESNYSGYVRSTGFELSSNLHLLRFIAPIELGFRTSYLFENSYDFDFLFNISFTL